MTRSRPLVLLAAALLGALACVQPAVAADAGQVVRDTPGVVAHWPLDERAGTVVTDALGGLTGTITGTPVLGAPTARSDDHGSAIGLSATSATALGSSLSLAGDASLEAWVLVQPGTTGTRYAVSKGNASSGLHLMLDGSRRVLFRVGTGSGATTATGPALATGTWHQIVGTLAGRAAAVYVDGRSVASASLPAAPTASTRELYLGRYSGSASGYWQGRLDEVSLYGRALSATEVATHYAAVADATPPAVTLTSTPPRLGNGDGATIAFTATKSQSTFACRLDGGSWAPCDGSASYRGLAEGSHEVAVLATDRYGIAALAPATATWRVDRTPPETLMLASATADGLTRASFSSEAGASFECRTGSGAWSACATPASVPNGTSLAVRARDGAGNVDPSPATVASALSLGAGAQEYAGASASFVVSGARSSSGLQCRLDGGAWQPCPAPLTFTAMGYGDHELAVRDERLSQLSQAPSLAWRAALPTPRLIAARFPSILKFASRRAQRATKPARAPRLLFASNVDATATATLARRGRRVATWPLAIHRGSNTLVLPITRLRRLRPGRHTLVIHPSNAAGAGRALSVRFDVLRLRRG
jgi:concanavalin A-like lectin/glucanase superfamily protein